MLPTLTLGLPGNAVAAAILAALEVKNVVVGPTILTENLGLIYFIYVALIIANFLMYGMAIALVKTCVTLFSLPRTLLMPLIILLCVVAAFTVGLDDFHVYLAFVAGIIGYVLHRFGFPLAPMMLALILGPLADENFWHSLRIFVSKFETREWTSAVEKHWIGVILIVVVVYTFYDGIFKRGKEAEA